MTNVFGGRLNLAPSIAAIFHNLPVTLRIPRFTRTRHCDIVSIRRTEQLTSRERPHTVTRPAYLAAGQVGPGVCRGEMHKHSIVMLHDVQCDSDICLPCN